MQVKALLSSLRAMDALNVLFLLLLSLANLIFSSRIQEWWLLILLNLSMGTVIVFLPRFATKRPSPFLIFLRNWYLVPVTLVVFKELYLMIHPINPHDFDELFIAIDRWMFGVDPTRWMAQWATPLLTELMQFAYSSFYFLFLIVGMELYKRKRMEEFEYGAFLCLFGFYLSYVVYFFFPAVGPRFSLHEFETTNTDLPGLLFTNALRDFVNMAESIPRNSPNPIDFAQRDVFPSGHVQLTLVLMFFSYRYRVKSRHVIAVVGTLLVISTVYLRYHYVIDAIAGVLFMLLTIGTARHLYRWWSRKREEWEFAIKW